jgi:hypothetical protein
LNTSFQPSKTFYIAHTSGTTASTAALTDEALLWQLSRGIRTTPDGNSEAALTIVTGDAATARAAQAEEAAAVVATHPIVVCAGGDYVKKKYREVLLLPTNKEANGRAVWATAGGGLHLYRMTDGDWCLNDAFQPDQSYALAHVDDSFSASPPVGAASWQLGKLFCDVKQLGGKGSWATGSLVLLTGADAAAHATRHEAQVLALRTHLSNELGLVEAQVQAATEFTAGQLDEYLASQSANINSLAMSLPAAAREAVALEFRRAGWDSHGR